MNAFPFNTRPSPEVLSQFDKDFQDRINSIWDTIEGSRNSQKNRETLAMMILAQTKPKNMWPKSDILHPGNWPVDAIFGIEVETFHRDFGNRSGGKCIKYFNSKGALNRYLIDEENYIRSIDYAYSAHVHVYEWDWGPVDKGFQYLG